MSANPCEDLVYVIPLEKFIYRAGDEWKLAEPLGKDGALNFLLYRGVSFGQANQLFKECTYLRVLGYDTFPGEDSLVSVDDLLYLNLWAKPELSPAPGPYPRVAHVLDWVTNGDERGQKWIKHWMAAKVQDPTYMPKVAIVMTTAQGGGKGTLAAVMFEMLGAANCTKVERDELESKFNARYVSKLFVLGDEVLAEDNMKSISEQLKILIDSKEVRLEAKYANQRSVKNRLAWMFASNNHVSPLVLEPSDRRYSVFANSKPITPEYKDEVRNCFSLDGKTMTDSFKAEVAGFWYELLHTQVDRKWITAPYENAARRNLIAASQPVHESFFEYVDSEGLEDLLAKVMSEYTKYDLKNTTSTWDFGPRGISTKVLYYCYSTYCRESGGKPRGINRFGAAIKSRTPTWPQVSNRTPEGKRVNCYIVPRGQKDVAEVLTLAT